MNKRLSLYTKATAGKIVYGNNLLVDTVRNSLGEEAKIQRAISESIIFEVSNIYQYTYDNKLQSDLWSAKLHPILAPQYKRMWFEYNTGEHEYTLQSVSSDSEINLGNNFAILMEIVEIQEMFNSLKGYDFIKKAHKIENFDFEARWMLTMFIIFGRETDKTPILPGYGAAIYVKEDGSIDSRSDKAITLLFPDDVASKTHNIFSKEYQLINNFIYRICQPALMAMSFMHCKNVEKIDYDPDSTHLSRSTRRKTPNIAYKTLKINTISGQQSEGSGQKTGLHMPMHIARGHFKTYTEDAPLMGKHIGTYWWGSQLRGQKQYGEIIKDYVIDDPTE